MMFRPKSKPVEARQWTGANLDELAEWMDYAFVGVKPYGHDILIENSDGRVVANTGDWIVKDGGFYPVEPAMFALEYEAAT